MVDYCMREKKFHGLVHTHAQHISRRLALVMHCQSFRVEAGTIACIASHFDVRQKTHLNLLQSLASAGIAAPAWRIERKTSRIVPAHARFLRARKQLADGVPEADVRGGTGARRLADRRLVDFQYAV